VRRWLSAALFGALLCSAAVGMAGPAGADTGSTTTSTTLPLTSFAHLIVDDAAGYVFATGGSGTSGVVVRDMSGNAVTVIHNEAGADGLALSPDGATLYVALRDDSSIAAIDTATLTESARYFTGGDICPSTLAVLGSQVWFGYGCGESDGGIGLLDLGVSPAAVHTGLADLRFAPMLATSDALPATLVAGGGDGAELYEFQIDGTALNQVAHRYIAENLAGLTITPDGSTVLTASGAEYDIAKYSTGDLSRLGQYGAQDPYPVAVAVTSSDQVIAGLNSADDDDVRVFSSGGEQTGGFDFNGSDTSFSLARDGIALDTAADRMYAVTDPYGSGEGTVSLHVVTDPVPPPTVVTLSAPASAGRATSVQVTGTIATAGVPVDAATLTVTRTDAAGSHPLAPVTSDSAGQFGFTDVPDVGGAVSYVVTYAGDDNYLPATRVADMTVTDSPATLTISSSPRYAYGARATVRVHLGTSYNDHNVAVYATPFNGAKTLIKTVTVDKQGDAALSYRMVGRTKFTASFAGDYRYAPRTVSTTSLVIAKLRSSMAKSKGARGKYARYDRRKGAALSAEVTPADPGDCLKFQLQKKSHGGWYPARSKCYAMNEVGVASGVAKGTPGVRYRLRVEFLGDPSNTATRSGWYYIEFV
jgi:YVTN family beta-propeller protein